MKVLWLLLMVCGAAQAQEWSQAVRGDDVTVLVRYARANTLWVVHNLDRRDPDGAMSARMLMEFDCRGRRFKVLSSSRHTDLTAQGRVLSTGGEKDWQMIPPGTLAEGTSRGVCSP